MTQSNKPFANVGSIIEFHDGVQGIVEIVYTNSVLVNILDYDEEMVSAYKSDKTIINHKNYELIQ